MIRIDVVQGTKEWLDAKVGIPSASNFSRILTPKTMKPSSSMAGYAHELLAEQILGRPLDDATSEFMQRGTVLEKHARDWYSLQKDVDVEQVGFLLTDDRRAGCSPDGLIGSVGGLEIKCPSAAVHIGYLLGEAGEKYRCQVQGGMLITDREWWDFVSYNPDLPSALVRFNRDETFIKALSSAVNQFCEVMYEAKQQLMKYGLFEGEQIPALKLA